MYICIYIYSMCVCLYIYILIYIFTPSEHEVDCEEEDEEHVGSIHRRHPTPLVYAIHHTILAMAISCKGRAGEGLTRYTASILYTLSARVNPTYMYSTFLGGRRTGIGSLGGILLGIGNAPAASRGELRGLTSRGLNTKGTRAHTHRELIREWLWEPKGSSLGCI